MLEEIKRFEVKEQHLKLISKMWVQYNDYTEFGAPEIDPKRPYGNSDVYDDIAEILNIKKKGDDFTAKQEKEMLQLHMDTAIAIQIFFVTGKMETGIYEKSQYGIDWKKIK